MSPFTLDPSPLVLLYALALLGGVVTNCAAVAAWRHVGRRAPRRGEHSTAASARGGQTRQFTRGVPRRALETPPFAHGLRTPAGFAARRTTP